MSVVATPFGQIDLQPQPPFQFVFYPPRQPVSLVAGQDDEVVRVAHKSCFGPLCRPIVAMEQFVKPVQVDVGQKGGDDSYLGRSFISANLLWSQENGGVPELFVF